MAVIEKATVSDAEEILLLQKLAYKSEVDLYHDLTIQSNDSNLQSIQDEFKHQIFFKDAFDEKMIGSVRTFARGYTCHVGNSCSS